MSRNLKINNYMNKKTLVIPQNSNNIFKLNMQEIISEISNYVKEEKQEEKQADQAAQKQADQADQEKQEEYENFCRICFEENNYYDNRLISPCLCKGTQKFIHVECLKEWRQVNENNPEKRDKCEICNFNFIIKNQIDFLYYKEDVSFIMTFFRHFYILFFSIIYGTIDYNSDFFTVKILNLLLIEDCKILKNFNIMKKNINYNGKYNYFIFYLIFIFSFINFLTYSVLICKILKKRNKIQNYEYKTTVYKKSLILKIQQTQFLFYYYIALIIDDVNFLACVLPIICFINTFSYNIYILHTNKLLDRMNNIDEEVIYSFEDNPLLDIQSLEDIE